MLVRVMLNDIFPFQLPFTHISLIQTVPSEHLASPLHPTSHMFHLSPIYASDALLLMSILILQLYLLPLKTNKQKNLPIDQPHFQSGYYFHFVLIFTVQPPLLKHTSHIWSL